MAMKSQGPEGVGRRRAVEGAQQALDIEHGMFPFPLHAARTVPIGYDPSVTLYRVAVARAAGARARRREFESTGKRERRLREADHCLEVVLLTHAALESWINWSHLHSGLKTTGTWINRWTEGCNQIAESRGHPPPSPIPTEVTSFLAELGAWRNFLAHGDERARLRLLDLIGEINFGDALNADLATETIRLADLAFTYGGSVTGIVAPHSSRCWVALDEA